MGTLVKLPKRRAKLKGEVTFLMAVGALIMLLGGSCVLIFAVSYASYTPSGEPYNYIREDIGPILGYIAIMLLVAAVPIGIGWVIYQAGKPRGKS